MRLLGAEVRRFGARRVVRGFALLALALVLAGVGIATARSGWRTEPRYVEMGPDPACVSPLGPGGAPTPPPPGCEPDRTAGTAVGGVRMREVRVDERLHFARDYTDAVRGVSIPLLLAALLLGASFIGAEYGGHSLGTQLLFEPRRFRVFAAKGGAAALGTAGFTAAVLVVLGAALYAGAALEGVTRGVDAAWLADRAGDVARLAALCALAALTSHAVGAVTRHTVAAVLSLAATGALVEPALMAAFRGIGRWLPVTSFVTVTWNDLEFAPEGVHSLGQAAAVAGAWAAVLLAGAAALFARREVR